MQRLNHAPHPLLIMVLCLFHAHGAIGGTEPRPSTLWYTRPAQNWNEALPIGNGRLGAMVFGRPREELLQLNEGTLWSGGPRSGVNPDAKRWLPLVRQAIFAGKYAEGDELVKNMQGPFTQSYMPLGDLQLNFTFNSSDEPTDYRRELDLERAVTLTTFKVGGVTYTREVFASFPDQVIAVLIWADRPASVSVKAALSSPLRSESNPDGDDRIVMRGRCPFQVEPNYRSAALGAVYDERPHGEGVRFTTILRAFAAGGSTTTDAAGALHVEHADSLLLLLSVGTSFNGYDKSPGAQGRDADGIARKFLDAASSRKIESLVERHVADSKSLFGRVSLDLGASRDELPTDDRIIAYKDGNDPGLAALVFQFGRYLLIASSRPGSQPANLQGIWNNMVRPPWSSNYTMNINSQMNYWPAELANLSECHEPMLRYISELAVTGRETARVNYGARGWCAHHNGDLWRNSTPVGAYGQGDPTWANFALGGVWHCMDLWEHYAFTQDRNYLRQSAYPLMKGAAEFCLDWLIEDPSGSGRLVTAPSYSTENSFFDDKHQAHHGSAATTQDMALIWDLFTNCIEACDILSIDQEFRATLAAARDRLVPYQVGKRGQLQEWAIDFDEPEPNQRHMSHLIGLFPGKQLSPEGTPALAQAVRRTLELRGDDSTGWSMAWKVNLWARLKDGDHAHRVVGYLLRLTGSDKVAYNGGGIYTNLFDAHPPFQIDGNFGVTAGIAEMLVQSYRRTHPPAAPSLQIIELLPALPKAWATGSAKGLRARGGFEVDLAWSDGVIQEATIRSALGGTCELIINGRTIEVVIAPQGSYTAKN